MNSLNSDHNIIKNCSTLDKKLIVTMKHTLGWGFWVYHKAWRKVGRRHRDPSISCVLLTHKGNINTIQVGKKKKTCSNQSMLKLRISSPRNPKSWIEVRIWKITFLKLLSKGAKSMKLSWESICWWIRGIIPSTSIPLEWTLNATKLNLF